MILSPLPFLLAIYSQPHDAAIVVRLPDDLGRGQQLRTNDRMLAVLTAPDPGAPLDPDVVLGPGATVRGGALWPVVADVLAVDDGRTKALRASIPEERWTRCFWLGRERLGAAIARDGRPTRASAPSSTAVLRGAMEGGDGRATVRARRRRLLSLGAGLLAFATLGPPLGVLYHLRHVPYSIPPELRAPTGDMGAALEGEGCACATSGSRATS